VTRKLRELLYAVELERTLGKPRILALYLAVAPWGDGVCGAAQAARRRFGKPARELDPIEAAWLATLLRDPNAAVDPARLAWVLKGMAAPPKAKQRWIEQLPERLTPSATDADAP
jgi:membrane peptidoglycan carboxypeptidase